MVDLRSSTLAFRSSLWVTSEGNLLAWEVMVIYTSDQRLDLDWTSKSGTESSPQPGDCLIRMSEVRKALYFLGSLHLILVPVQLLQVLGGHEVEGEHLGKGQGKP